MAKLSHDRVRAHRLPVVERLEPHGGVGVAQRRRRDVFLDLGRLNGQAEAGANITKHPTILSGEQQPLARGVNLEVGPQQAPQLRPQRDGPVVPSFQPPPGVQANVNEPVLEIDIGDPHGTGAPKLKPKAPPKKLTLADISADRSLTAILARQFRA